MIEYEIVGTTLTAKRPNAGVPWTIVDGDGKNVTALPREATVSEVDYWCIGYNAGREGSQKTSFRAGFETGRRIMRADVLKALGVYDSMCELQAQARILADISTERDG